MNWDWSEQWLQDAAGWRVVKDAKRYLAADKIADATIIDDLCTGTVLAGKTHKVRLNRKSHAVAEVFCTCLENRKNGTFCEHAAAVVLAWAQKKSTTPQSQNSSPTTKPPQTTTAQPVANRVTTETIPAFRIELPPQWIELAQKGRWSVKIEHVATTNPSEEDKRLFVWLRGQGISDISKPLFLTLNNQTVASLLRALWQHSRVKANGQLIAWRELPIITYNSNVSNNRLHLSLEGNQEWRALKGTPFFLKNGEIAYVEDQELYTFLFILFTEESFEVTLSQLFHTYQIRDYLAACDESSFLHQWQNVIIQAEVYAVVFGSMERPQIRMQAKLGSQKAPPHGDLIHCDELQAEVCDWGNYEKCLSWLEKEGWQRVGETDTWKAPDEACAIHFWDKGMALFQKLVDNLDFAPGLKELIGQFNRVEALLQTSQLTNGATSLSLGFRTSSGKELNADKIIQLLRSGKRLIQTSDGSSLLLPKESWEAFQASITQANWKEHQGRYFIEKGQNRILREMRKNISNDTSKESVQESSTAKKSIASLENVSLRKYQEEGIYWLHDRLEDEGFALLADEMGLGKTLQSIAILSSFAKSDSPALVIMPTTLIGNWKQEIEKFNQTLKTYVHHGDRRDANLWDQYNVIVTSYKVLGLDRATFMKQTFSLVILDEASLIRNPDTDAARACFRLSANRRLALTGTPVENQLRDLWAIFQFLQPGYLGERKAFEQRFCGKIVNPADRTALQWRAKPYILRRTKNLVAKDLPEKIEIDEWCELSDTQQEWYRGFSDQGLALVDRCETDAQARMQMLTLILRLRQTCCDLALLDPTTKDDYSLEQRSGKMIRLLEIVQECLANGSKVLIFSQFSRQLHLISEILQEMGVASLLLDGSSTNRSELVADFQRIDGPSVFLVSLKAGGYGLNLTAADTVILFEPWWNPAVEKQAMDRAHRIGQKKTVFVYRLLTRGTMEERVKKFQDTKNDLMSAVMEDSDLSATTSVSFDEIRQIFGNHDFSAL